MVPALAPGDRVVAGALAYRFRSPRRGEIVVLRPADASDRLDIKRIAAGPGETVVNGGRPAILGPQEWFVVGDNAAESNDSRNYGPARRRDLIGPVWFKY